MSLFVVIKTTKTDAVAFMIVLTLLMAALAIITISSGGQVKVWENTSANSTISSNGTTETYTSINHLVPVDVIPAPAKLALLVVFTSLTLLIDHMVWVMFTRKRKRRKPVINVIIDKPLSPEQIANLTQRVNLKLQGDSDALAKEQADEGKV